MERITYFSFIFCDQQVCNAFIVSNYCKQAELCVLPPLSPAPAPCSYVEALILSTSECGCIGDGAFEKVIKLKLVIRMNPNLIQCDTDT